ncbi:MAG: extracellular solute-binding protein [Deltaproteobacteria bacterium]|nr:extracellular solute-binding protein [Deltaproteobacteria bacterium]
MNAKPVVVCAIGLFLAIGNAMPAKSADEKTLELAKKEGRVSFYTSMGADESKMVADAFQAKYPAIKVEITRLGSEKLLQRMLNEYRAGSHLFDTVTNSGMEIVMLGRAKMLARHMTPEFSSFMPESRDANLGWADMYSNLRLVAFNTRAVTKDKIPRRYEDLLEPLWKGQIGFPEGQYSWFATMLKIMGEEAGKKFFQGLARQNLHYRNSQVLVTQFVAAGEFSLGFVYDTQVLRFKKRGAPIDIAPMPFITKNIHPLALAAHAPHPNAGKVFIDYVLSKEGQTFIKNMGRVISRSDIPQEEFAKTKMIFDDPTIVDRLPSVIEDYKRYLN